MDAARLFVDTLRDLDQRTVATDEYTVLMSAALLRKLLLDQDRLIHVNNAHRLKIRFQVGGVSPLEHMIYEQEPDFWTIEDCLDPESPLAHTPCEATLDQFLKRRVMRYEGHWITVHDVINQLANIEGAVHSSKAKTARQQALQSATAFYSRAGLPAALSLVKVIGKITARGLAPLRNAVIAAGSATWASVGPTGTVEMHDKHGSAEETP